VLHKRTSVPHSACFSGGGGVQGKEKYATKVSVEASLTTTAALSSADVPEARYGKLSNVAILKQRMTERSVLTDVARMAVSATACPVFQRHDTFLEHKKHQIPGRDSH
jgi:hypothetical protein